MSCRTETRPSTRSRCRRVSGNRRPAHHQQIRSSSVCCTNVLARALLVHPAHSRFLTIMRHTNPRTHSLTIGNESVPIQPAQCWFPGLAISDARSSTIWTGLLCPTGGGHFGIAQSVRLSVPWRSSLGYRHAGCLQLSHQRCVDCGGPVRGRT